MNPSFTQTSAASLVLQNVGVSLTVKSCAAEGNLVLLGCSDVDKCL